MSKLIEQSQARLVLYRGWDQKKHVWSPYVIKLEARLRFAGVPYQAEAGSPIKAPRGKIPYLDYQGSSDKQSVQLADSTVIIKHLVGKKVLPEINGNLSATARAHDLAIRALLEEKLYFYHLWELWNPEYYTMRDYVLATLPYPARVVVGLIVYRRMKATLDGQGTGRNTVDEIRSFREEIWININALLIEAKAKSNNKSKKQFWILGGENPTEADATLFGFIESVLAYTAAPEAQKVMKSFSVVLEYADRIHDAYFPDYEKS